MTLMGKFTSLIKLRIVLLLRIAQKKKTPLGSETGAHGGMEPLSVHLRRITQRHEAVGISCHPSLSCS